MRTRRRCRSAAIALALLCFALMGLSQRPAQAVEITCIEASRYKYIYRIFGDDPRRFAKFFNIDPRSAPAPETCRAMLITGPIERLTREAVQAQSTDTDKLIAAIGANRGGLATLYLASPGGNVAAGLRMGFLTRMFWLKAHAVDGPDFTYVPDFLSPGGPGAAVTVVPPELEAGWAAYVEATRHLLTVRLTPDNRRRRCASACTFIFAGGIHRFGPAYFHRARRAAPKGKASGAAPDSEPSLTEMVDGLQKTEQRVTSFYRQMDAGEAAIRAFQMTATQTASQATMPSMPRYVDDHLRTTCNTRGRSPREQLRMMAPQAETNTDAPPSSNPAMAAEPQAQLAPPGGDRPKPPATAAPRTDTPAPPLALRALHHCVAGAHERERMRQFAKLCPGRCDRESLVRETTTRMRALTPEEQTRENTPSSR